MSRFFSALLWLCAVGVGTLLVVSCSGQDPEPEMPRLVVEGYIDDQGFPVVMLTTSVAVAPGYNEPIDSLGSHLLRWARVAVSDGEREVVLTGKLDKSYLPPYIYTTTHMRGEAGKSYTLTIDYGDFHATAVTTIPEPPMVDSIWVKPVEGDSLCSVMVSFTDFPDPGNYYKAFVRRGRYGRQWLPAYLGTVNDEVLDGGSCQLIVNKSSLVTDTTDYVPFFSYNDTLSLKFAQIDQQAYRFWNDFDTQTNFSRNPLFSFAANLHGNIDGAFGCWYGCGAVIRSLILRDYAKQNKGRQTQY